MTKTEDRHAAIASRVADLAQNRPRTVIAVAGPPASGKSTLARDLAEILTASGIPAKVVPMDGFHLDNATLRQRGLLARKGAPETFDAEGFIALVNRIKTGGAVSIPLFDRHRDVSVADADTVPANCKVVIVEGNYLLFDEPPWNRLADLWDLSISLEVPADQLRERLVQRWIDHGMTPEASLARAEANDLPNAERVRSASLLADLVLSNSNGE
jgi:pantothenate kinase